MRLLLDEHVPRAPADALARDGFDVLILADWLGGIHRMAVDEAVLSAAFADDRILFTFDTRTVPGLLTRLAEEGRHHAGVIVVGSRSAHPTHIGRLLLALRRLEVEAVDWDWQDRLHFLRVG